MQVFAPDYVLINAALNGHDRDFELCNSMVKTIWLQEGKEILFC